MTDFVKIVKERESEALKQMTDEELLSILRKCPDFEKLVFPDSWYRKYELPEKKCLNMKEFIRESPWMNRNYNYIEGRIVDIPAKEGGMRPLLPAPEIPAETRLVNSFTDKPCITDQTEISNQQETQ